MKVIQCALLLVCTVLHSLPLPGVKTEKCELPQEWRGRWWQNNLGNVTIRNFSIATKGTCVRRERDYFVLNNRVGKCNMCILFIPRHENLLQYKESYCYSNNDNPCEAISVDSLLHTLVRVPNNKIRCPFQDAYYFKFRHHHSVCERDMSYAQPCAGNNEYRLDFSHCSRSHDDTPSYINGVTELECLATWKDGSDTYLYGRLENSNLKSRAEEYKCFKYKIYGTVVNMSMSADPTCRGVHSADHGDIMFQFTKDTGMSLSPACEFPQWLWGVETWRDIEGHYIYSLSRDKRVMYAHYVKRNRSKPQIKTQYSCKERQNSYSRVTILSSSTLRCALKEQCLRFELKGNGVIEFQQGDARSDTRSDDSDRCNNADYTQRRILLDDSAPPQPCPTPMLYTINPPTDCYISLEVGCKAVTRIELLSDCDDYEEGFVLSCMANWHADGVTYVAVKNARTNSRLYNCFSFRESRGVQLFGRDDDCNSGINDLYRFVINHNIVQHGQCDRPINITLPPFSTSSSTPTTSTTTTRIPPDISDGSGSGPPDVDIDDDDDERDADRDSYLYDLYKDISPIPNVPGNEKPPYKVNTKPSDSNNLDDFEIEENDSDANRLGSGITFTSKANSASNSCTFSSPNYCCLTCSVVLLMAPLFVLR